MEESCTSSSSFQASKARHTKSRPQSSRRIFPYCCLRAFGPAQTCLVERMIVANWWLNLYRGEQATKTTEFAAKLFQEPPVSATLRNNYDPSKNPKAIGVLDVPDLRKHAQKTATRITYSMKERNGKRSGCSCDETKPLAFLRREPRGTSRR